MRYLLLTFLVLIGYSLLAQNEIPLRDKDDYEIKIEYDFKKKPIPSHRETNYVLIQEKNDQSLLPHLTVYLTLKNSSSEEFRIRAVDNTFKVMASGKIKEEPLELVLGYMVDIKERISAHTFTVTILTKKREPINQIILQIKEDGTFLVNGIEKGKF